jgi:hypothetical protein
MSTYAFLTRHLLKNKKNKNINKIYYGLFILNLRISKKKKVNKKSLKKNHTLQIAQILGKSNLLSKVDLQDYNHKPHQRKNMLHSLCRFILLKNRNI